MKSPTLALQRTLADAHAEKAAAYRQLAIENDRIAELLNLLADQMTESAKAAESAAKPPKAEPKP